MATFPYTGTHWNLTSLKCPCSLLSYHECCNSIVRISRETSLSVNFPLCQIGCRQTKRMQQFKCAARCRRFVHAQFTFHGNQIQWQNSADFCFSVKQKAQRFSGWATLIVTRVSVLVLVSPCQCHINVIVIYCAAGLVSRFNGWFGGVFSFSVTWHSRANVMLTLVDTFQW